MPSIRGLRKAEVLKALYDNARVVGSMCFELRPNLTVEECEELLEKNDYFDYLYGRVMKVDLSGDSFDSRLYNRDNGLLAAELVINKLRHGRAVGVTIDLTEGVSYSIGPCDPVLTLVFRDAETLDKVLFLLNEAREKFGV